MTGRVVIVRLVRSVVIVRLVRSVVIVQVQTHERLG
jgi:hypothetical protein